LEVGLEFGDAMSYGASINFAEEGGPRIDFRSPFEKIVTQPAHHPCGVNSSFEGDVGWQLAVYQGG